MVPFLGIWNAVGSPAAPSPGCVKIHMVAVQKDASWWNWCASRCHESANNDVQHVRYAASPIEPIVTSSASLRSYRHNTYSHTSSHSLRPIISAPMDGRRWMLGGRAQCLGPKNNSKDPTLDHHNWPYASKRQARRVLTLDLNHSATEKNCPDD